MATAATDSAMEVSVPPEETADTASPGEVSVDPSALELACLRTQVSVLEWQTAELHAMLFSHRRLAEGVPHSRPLPPAIGLRASVARYRQSGRLTDDAELILVSLLDSEGVLSLRSRVAALIVVSLLTVAS